MEFMNVDFMLENQKSKVLYEKVKKTPIFDFHCHINPKEIYEDKNYKNIVDLWLGGDHYKWRLMRYAGIDEKYITGNAIAEEKFQKWAETLTYAFGHPLYHWSHLEMFQLFGIRENLTLDNWKSIYDRMNRIIVEEQFSPRKLLKKANVKFIGTTDHPLDDLQYHEKLIKENYEVIVAPTFRPDELFVEHKNFNNFILELSKKTNIAIDDYDSLVQAIDQRIRYFKKMGCRAADHSIEKIVYQDMNKDQINMVLKKAINNEVLTEKEINGWQTAILRTLHKIYTEENLVSQIHFGAIRNNNSKKYSLLGADSGFDSICEQIDLSKNLNKFLNNLLENDILPKIIFYNLNPSFNKILPNTLGNFQDNQENVKGKLQFGAGWWFNDTEYGMRQQMLYYSEEGILGEFIGMLTDSRSLLSYQRHDYFRRILSSLIGEWVEKGKIPNDEQLLNRFMQKICYENAERYFLGDE
ncbi:glucuronate isomerase [Atopobacter phocae]|uniref:glucuronate isomerase n=1 Tax=Atopobacter phocae TaxID=136492 RepID=UPI00047212D7|nr:glucuronate isomerase [Atopobacter phocae]